MPKATRTVPPISIRQRTIIAGLVLLLVALPSAGWALSHAFERSVTASFDARLTAWQNVLVAALEVNAMGELEVQDKLGDHRFHEIYSGWYWQISSAEQTLALSRSLWDQRLQPSVDGVVNNLILRPGIGPQQQALRVSERDYLLAQLEQPIHVMVGGPVAEIDREVAAFNQVLWLALAGLAAVLLLFLAVQLRWVLAPLASLSHQLQRLRHGGTCGPSSGAGSASPSSRLDSAALSSELKPLAEALNDVLERDEKLLEHSRAAAANLAHSLKTPLAVMQSQLAELPPQLAAEFTREIHRMDQVVQHHLARAAAVGTHQLAAHANLQAALQPILAAIASMAKQRQRKFSYSQLDQPQLAAIAVPVAAPDLQEIVGNLLENALKYSHQQLSFSATISTTTAATVSGNVTGKVTGNVKGVADATAAPPTLLLQIDDDGPGMTDEQCQQALARGKRHDMSVQGSGIGLTVAAELAHLYGVEMQLGPSHLGGLQVQLRFNL
ncbi:MULTISPECIES: ATP-binding protein [Idiomarina]|uniref:ATP-binding protein n=1 Tax=Idiomarina TaxID=135575 RepID=UPI00138A253B|nr:MULTISPECIES: ATP-binding protein [Idiomarina]UUN12785.1 sensor histidine kinase [Idiomarina loihiensis]